MLSKRYMINLDDLKPAEATFVLSEFPGKTFTLKKFSLAARIWVNQRFGKDNIPKIFERQSLSEISEIVFYLLKDKATIPTLEDFQENIVTQKDNVAVMQALLTTIGISEPVIENLKKSIDQGNAPSLSQPTGAQSTT
jgi:hypothetical protein